MQQEPSEIEAAYAMGFGAARNARKAGESFEDSTIMQLQKELSNNIDSSKVTQP